MTNGYRRPSSVALAAAIALLVSGCASRPGQTTRMALGDVLAVSSPCQCRFRYPAAWFLRTAIGDTSQPQLALHSYNDAALDHLPVPTRSADIGLDWRPDPDGLLYRAISAPHAVSLSGLAERRTSLVVSGLPAVSYAHWTGAPSAGGVYEQHVYLWAPASQRDYDLSLLAGNPPGRDVARARAVFARVLRSLIIGLHQQYRSRRRPRDGQRRV